MESTFERIGNTNLRHFEDGTRIYLLADESSEYNGLLHNENGPSVVCCDERYMEWRINGRRHNAHGPCVIATDGELEFWIDNELLWHDRWEDSGAGIGRSFKDWVVAAEKWRKENPEKAHWHKDTAAFIPERVKALLETQKTSTTDNG